MQGEQTLRFGPYRLDLTAGQLWRGKQEVKLTGKAFAVLRHLVTHAGELITKEALFQAVWPQTIVSEAALSSCLKELRQALRDQASQRRYIATVHRRGFRFLGRVVSDQQEEATQKAKVRLSFLPAPSPQPPTSPLVGRAAELGQLHQWLVKALHGERQVVFVRGEPGIGKTTLVEAFLSGVRSHEKFGVRHFLLPTSNAERPSTSTMWVGVGRCVEHYGAGEAYLPILEALGRLCRESGGAQLIALLKQHASTWLVQMPALLNEAELEILQRKTAGVTRERMVRELAEALEVITAARPLVLVLEDLHWSDVSTLDLLSLVARRQEPARLLIIGTYRPVEVLTRAHPLKAIAQELQLHGQCEELALDFLSEEHVAEYLKIRFPAGARHAVPLQRLAHVIHQRTDGNPLFMVNVVNDLIAQGGLMQTKDGWELRGEVQEQTLRTPVNLRQMIEQQLAQVSPEERKVLEAASVAGAEFSAAAVAAGTELYPEEVEMHCDRLVQCEQFLRPCGTTEWPDGTIAARYGFGHALYQEVLYERLSASRRIRLHTHIGEREEQGYGERAREIAAELALHFERGRNYQRAVQYLQYAGENAVQRSAYQNALGHFTKGLELLALLPQTHERNLQELTLQNLLGDALTVAKGWAAEAVEAVYSRALVLCQQVGETPRLSSVLEGLFALALVRAELQKALELGEQCLLVAQHLQTSQALLWAHHALGETVFHLGEFASAQKHFVRGIALYDSQQHSPSVNLAQVDPGVVCLSWVAQVLWYLGYADQSQQQMHEALTLVETLSHPFSGAYALSMAAELHQLRHEQQLTQERAAALVTLATEQGFSARVAEGMFLQGWALTMQRHKGAGIPQMRWGLSAWHATGANIGCSYQLALLAEAYGEAGQPTEGLAALVEAVAFMNKTGERFYEAELYRLKGELILQQFKVQGSKFQVENPQSAFSNPQLEAEECFLKAIEIACKQQAKSWELRASTSLARLWQQQGKQKQAHKLLSEIYGWFTEGFDTKDLQEAKALLEELSR